MHTHTRALQRDNNKWSRESSTNALLFVSGVVSFSSSQDVANFAFHVDTFATQFFKYIMISFETGGEAD